MSFRSWFASCNAARVLRPRRRPNVRLSLERLEERSVPTVNFGAALALGSAGQSGANSANYVATDATGNVFVGGNICGTIPVNFAPPGANPVILNPTNFANNTTGYIAKYSPGEQQLLWVEPVTSSDWTRVTGMAVDGSGDVIFGVYDNTTRITSLNKYDPNGNLLWTNNLNQSLSIQPLAPTAIALDNTGNVYLNGLPASVSYQSYVAKFSGTNGSLAWHETYAQGNYAASASHVAVDATGNLWLTGTFEGKVNFNPNGTYYLKSYGSSTVDAYALKLDNNGNFLWAGVLGTDTLTQGGGVTVDGAGNVYLAGVFQLGKKTNDFNPGAGVAALAGGTSYLVKLDTNGNYQWGDGWKGVTFPIASDQMLAVDSAGNIYLTGYYEGSVNFNPGSGQNVLTAPPQTYQAFVLNLNNQGNFNWVAATSSNPFTLGNTAGAWGSSVAVDTSGNIAVAGSFNIPTNFDPGSGTYILSPNGYNPSTGQPVPNGFLWGLTQSNTSQPLLILSATSSGAAPNDTASSSAVFESSAGGSKPGSPAGIPATSSKAAASSANSLDLLFDNPQRLAELQWWAAAVGFQGKAKHDLTT